MVADKPGVDQCPTAVRRLWVFMDIFTGMPGTFGRPLDGSLIGEIDELKGRGPSSVTEVAALGANRNTVKVHFRNLEMMDFLCRKGSDAE